MCTEALKQFHWIEKHFEQFEDDMFDFHEFGIRKIAIRPYLALHRNEEKIRFVSMMTLFGFRD